jgi:hypothetical protein
MLPITLNRPIIFLINAAISLGWAHLKIKINATNGLEWAHYTFIYKNNMFALHSFDVDYGVAV